MIIKHLDPHEAQKIAAGEVIERPAHIIKELVENALDAQATKIVIAVKEGGKESITITDNGLGMIEEDARICFLRHTTSKIQNLHDLETINSFGFRGEALASICSVAHVALTTRHHTQEHGLTLELNTGKIIKDSPSGAPIGTTITVSHLFDAIPVRKKFLKTTQTELNAITQLFKAFCFSHQHVHFVLQHNESTLYNRPAQSSLIDSMACLFDPQIAQQCTPLASSDVYLDCSGAISGPHINRYDRSGIFLFVNKRWVKNYQLTQAVIKGYLNVLPSGKYPLAVIHMTVPGHEVDINVHPKKEEVVFLHPKKIEHAITHNVKATLETLLSEQLQETKHSFSTTSASYPVYATYQNTGQKRSLQTFNPASTFKKTSFDRAADTYSSIAHQTPFEKNEVPQPIAPEPIQLPLHDKETSFSQYPFLGQLHLTYLMFEHPEGLLLIDQHAAHERIIYEQLEQSFNQADSFTLLFPETLSVSPEVIATVQPYFSLLEQYGILIECVGPTLYVVKAKPLHAQSLAISELLLQMQGWITEIGYADTAQIYRSLTEKMRAQIACKAAVKAGDILPHEKVKQLLNDLEKTTHRFSCPHGRPTSWLLPRYDIEKKFKRKL